MVHPFCAGFEVGHFDSATPFLPDWFFCLLYGCTETLSFQLVQALGGDDSRVVGL